MKTFTSNGIRYAIVTIDEERLSDGITGCMICGVHDECCRGTELGEFAPKICGRDEIVLKVHE